MEQQEAKWYVLHTYAGYENIVEASIMQLVENNNLHNDILGVRIFTEQIIEERKGKRKVVESKTMPCYVFVKIRYSSQLWYMLTNTRGVTGFVGPQGKAWPLSEEEIKRLRLEVVVSDFSMKIGDTVRVISGPFDTMIGEIKNIDDTRQKVGVILNMFGRNTLVEMDFNQIEQVNR